MLDREMSADEHEPYRRALASSLEIGSSILTRGGAALDAVEQVVRWLEDDEKFNAGRGSVYNERGMHELDASIMDGRTLACGAVASVTTVRNPIQLARLVMEKSPNVMMMGSGAEEFGRAMGIELVDNHYFDTPRRLDELRRYLSQQEAAAADAAKLGTVGAVARDVHGNLAAATSTGGITGKRFGRVGDSPIIGAGTYADNRSVAVSCTGRGEEFIRHCVARDIAAMVEYGKMAVDDAVKSVLFGKLRPGDGGISAVDQAGNLSMQFNTTGMYRAAADSHGRFEIGIF